MPTDQDQPIERDRTDIHAPSADQLEEENPLESPAEPELDDEVLDPELDDEEELRREREHPTS